MLAKLTKVYNRGKHCIVQDSVTHNWAILKDKRERKNKRIFLSGAGLF
jgi:hypothetical protein